MMRYILSRAQSRLGRVVELSAGCRRVKTFESFYHEDDMAREIAGFLDCPIERIEFDPIYKDTSMFRGYSIEGDVDDDALTALTDYMREEQGLTSTLIKDNIFLTEKPFEETCIDWLDANYSGMEAVESKDYPGNVIYRFKQNENGPISNILFHDKANRKVYVNVSIWDFFEHHFDLEEYEVSTVIDKWLSTKKEYNLIDIDFVVKYGFYYNRFECCK